MKKEETKVIIFDLGGVVVSSFGKEFILNASKKLKISKKELRNLIKKYEPDLQKGRIDHIEFWNKILKDKKLNVSEKITKTLWIEPYKKYSKINKNVINLIKELKKDYIIGCISNSQEPHNTYNKKRGLFEYFSPCIISSQVGLRKPDKKIFQFFLKKAKCSPGGAIFIDDEKKLLVNANKLGIRTIHFKNYLQLKKDLNKILK